MEPLQCVEFYITSNPPLRQRGVDWVMQQVQGCKTNNPVLEILYEPEMPWFKVVTFPSDQDQVAIMVKTFLSRAMEELGVCERPCGEEGTGLPFDIVSDANFIPWAEFSAASTEYEKAFDDCRYPETVRPMPFRQIWTELVKVPGYTIENLFSFPREWHNLGFPNSWQSLETLTGCYLSYNIGKTTIYIGGKTDKDAVTRAVKILNNLLQSSVVASNHRHHVICKPGQQANKYAFKYLTHVGLLQTTYPLMPSEQDERCRLREAVSIRAARLDYEKHWVIDGSPYLCNDGRRLYAKSSLPFHAFNSLGNRPKEAESVFDLMNQVEQLILGNTQLVQRTVQAHQATVTTSVSRPSPRLSDLDHSNVSSKSEDLMFFDNDASCTQVQPAGIQQQSLLDDSPPLELVESSLLMETSIVKPQQYDKCSSTRLGDDCSMPVSLPDIRGTIASRSRSRLPVELMGIDKSLRERIKSLAAMMQFTPGRVSIRLKFGRFYMINLVAAEVDVGSGPYQSKNSLRKLLDETTSSGNMRFSTILTTIGQDADTIVGSSLSIPEWENPTTQVTYQIECSFKDEEFFVEVDANTFGYTCRGPSLEIGSVFIHSPGHAWDMKVCGDSSKNLDESTIHRAFGDIIVKSLHLFTTTKNNAILGLTANETLGLVIKRVAIRQVARYSNVSSMDSILSIIMTQQLIPGDARDKRRTWSQPRNDGRGQPNPKIWYEAHVSSLKMEQVIQENATLSIGDSASWDPNDLESQTLFLSLYGPALKMIHRLDGVGLFNDNGQSEGGHLMFKDYINERDEREGKTTFW